MSSLMTEIEIANAIALTVSKDTLTVSLDDGRVISTPISWYPRLLHATENERKNYRLIGNGNGIHWPDLDEDISIQGLIAGHHSMESQKSLSKWLESRK
jgi:hypothetical protein